MEALQLLLVLLVMVANPGLATFLKSNATSAMVLAGGYKRDGPSGLKTVEVFIPSANESCRMPSMPETRFYHSMDGLVACGGYSSSTYDNCVSFRYGVWVVSHLLRHRR